jgi:hypothetical protein
VNSMKLLVLLLLVAFVSGCSSLSVIVRVKDKDSGGVLAGIRVERYRPVSVIEKVLNPVGASYFPLRLAESKITDKNGELSFRKSTDEDMYRLLPLDTRPLEVTIWEKQIELSPTTNQVTGTNWGYSVWAEDGVLKHSVWQIRDWTRD